ncbi:site-specific integrase [soil metagenome]
MAKTLTITTLDKIKPGAARQEHPDAAQPGLYFVVQPTGARSWAVRYRHQGRPRKATLGSYPKVKLPLARELAQATLRAASEGKDPAGEKVEARRIAASGVRNSDLVKVVWKEYQERHLSTKRDRTAEAANGVFNHHVIPKLGKRRIGEITKRDILGILDDYIKAGHPSAANRARAVMTAFFNWALARDIIPMSPCAGIKPPSAVRFRDRVLSDDEVRWLWKACKEEPHPFGRMTQLAMLTGARRDEVRGITDSELKLTDKLWKLPAARAKNGREHDMHLSDTALAIIEAVPKVKNEAGLLFTTTGETPPSGFSRAKGRMDGLMLGYARAEAKKRGDDPAKVEIPDWVIHDLRRTMASGMARLGVQLPVIERCLNHVSGSFGGIVGVYQRHSFADEKRAALETWSAHIESLVGIKPVASNVTKLRAARR